MATLKAQFTAYTSSRSAKTANGTYPNEYTCAAPKEIAFGTKITVQGTGTKYDGRTYTVTDRGGAIKVVDGRYIFDLWLPSESECRQFGRRNGSVKLGTGSSHTVKNGTSNQNMLDIVEVAIKEIGTKSSSKYINWYGGFGPGTRWCAIFVSWCSNKAGISTSVIPKYASCSIGKSWFERKGLFKAKGTYTPKRGDIIFFLSSGASHTGIVEKCSGGKVYTVEGNTSNMVARRNYSLNDSHITGYGTPKYTKGNLSRENGRRTQEQREEEQKEKAREELKRIKAYQKLFDTKATPTQDMNEYEIVEEKGSTRQHIRVIIDNYKQQFEVPVEEGAILTLERTGQPGKFTFTTFQKNSMPFTEGNGVLLEINKKNIFYGFIFSKKRNKEGKIEVTCYDQMRYLNNEDILIYKKKSAGELIKMIADDYKLKCGVLDNTGYRMSAIEDGSTLQEMIENNLSETALHTGKTFVFYDKAGKLFLSEVSKLKINHVISEDTAEDFEYESSIDKDVYNQIKIIYKDDKTGVASIYMAKNTSSQNKWGVLQMTDDIPYNLYALGKLKAKVLLKYFNRKRRTLSVSGAIGNADVRAGCLVPVILNLGDMKVQNWMMVEKVTHKFGARHSMDIELIGGDFVV